MADLVPLDYDIDTGEFIWDSNRGPLVLFGTLSSIWALAWFVLVHKYEKMKLNEIVSLIQQLGFLKTKCMKEGRYLEETRDSERQFIYKRIGQQVYPYMDESRQKEFLEYDLDVPLPPMPSVSFIDKIALSKIFTSRFISFSRLKQLTYSVYLIGIVISLISVIILSLSLIPDFISDQSSVRDNQNFSITIIGLVYSPTLFLFLFFVWKWKRGYKQSLKKQMNLLADTCENAKTIEEIEKRLTKFILPDNATVSGLKNERGDILFPYLMFKKTNASWNFDMLSMSVTKYDYVYFLFSISALPILVILYIFLVALNGEISLSLTIFLNLAIFLLSFILLFLGSFIGTVGLRYLFFTYLRSTFELDSKRFAIRREGRLPEAYKKPLKEKFLTNSSIALGVVGLVISGVIFLYTRSFPIFLAIVILFFLPYMFISFLPYFAKSVKPETEETSEIRYVSSDQMFIRGFFAQYVWDVTLAVIVFFTIAIFIFNTAVLFYSESLTFAYIVRNMSLFAFLVSFVMLEFFVYYFSIQLIKDPIKPSLSAILEGKERRMMTSLSDPAISGELNKEKKEFKFSVLAAGKKFVEKDKRGRQWERFRAVAGSIFTYTVSLIIDFIV